MVAVCQAVLVFYNNFESKLNGHLQYNNFWPEITGFFLCCIGKLINVLSKYLLQFFFSTDTHASLQKYYSYTVVYIKYQE